MKDVSQYSGVVLLTRTERLLFLMFIDSLHVTTPHVLQTTGGTCMRSLLVLGCLAQILATQVGLVTMLLPREPMLDPGPGPRPMGP